MRTVFFDVGGVLIQQEDLVSDAMSLFGSPDRASFLKVALPHLERASCGACTIANSWQKLAEELGTDLNVSQRDALWVSNYEQKISPNPEVWDIIKQLQNDGCRLGIISNTIAPHAEIFLRYEVFKSFEKIFLSYQVGYAKGDRRIFDHALGHFDLTPEQAIFIDDTAQYVDDARRLGMDAIQFRDAEQLRAELQSRGLLANLTERAAQD